MKIPRLITLALFLATLHAVAAHAAPVSRQRINFDAGWKFHRGDIGVDSGGAITAWQWKSADDKADVNADTLTPDSFGESNDWKDAKASDDVFKGRKGYVWLRTIVVVPHGSKSVLHFESVDDNATVYINSKKVLHHEGWNDAFDISLPVSDSADEKINVAVLVENTAGAGGIGVASVQREFEAVASGPAAPDYKDSDWRKIHVPHDFVVEGTFTPTADAGHGSLPADVGWYRKTFDIPASDKGKSLWLDFDGIYRDARIWLNGKLLGRHKSGYIGVRYDISDAVNYGRQNVLAVRCDARAQEGWWYEGGGIYRHVWLTKTDTVHVAPDSLAVFSVVRANKGADVLAKLSIANQSGVEQHVGMRVQIQNSRGQHLSGDISEQRVGVGEALNYSTNFDISTPNLWSLEKPTLYSMNVRLYKTLADANADKNVIDEVTTHFGIRTIRFDKDKGFFLNNKPVKIQGTCNHQDFAGVGIAMTDSILEWRIEKLKEMGCNAYRTSHNPVAPELLDACDRLGMLVMDETRHLGDATGAKSGPGTKFDDLGELKSMILRDRNHPSIIMWSMANEEPLQGSEEGAKIFAAMKKVADELDGTRPTSAAMNGGWGSGFTNVQDVQGVNYSPNVYDGFHKGHPDIPMYGSETASEVGTRGEYVNDAAKGYVSAYSVNAPSWAQTSEVAWKAIAERDFVAGGFVWTGFDYKGEPTPYGWPCINSHFGIMDECGFPKDAYYYYKAWWSKEPVVHVFPHWNWAGKEGKPIDVWVHSNAEKVVLFLNGKNLGEKVMPRNGHLQWSVNYAPGTLEAMGLNHGKIVAQDKVETTGKPFSIVTELELRDLNADGEDSMVIIANVVDEQMRVVPYADNDITFEVTGAGTLAGLGNGDPSSHEADKATHRKAFHGRMIGILQAGNKKGYVEAKITSPSLKSNTVTIHVKQ